MSSALFDAQKAIRDIVNTYLGKVEKEIKKVCKKGGKNPNKESEVRLQSIAKENPG